MAIPDEHAANPDPAFGGADGTGFEYFDHIRRVSDIFYDQVKLSDQKAASVFTFMLARCW